MTMLTRDYWLVSSHQNFHDLTNAISEEEWREVASTFADLDRTHGTLAPSVTREQLMSWLAERASWQYLDDRITDLGWMFLVNSQPDEFLEGTGPHDPTAGPIVVVKGSGAVWWLSFSPNLARALGTTSAREFHQEMSHVTHPLWTLASSPDMIPVFSARHEDEFYKLMRAVSPVFDRTRPHGWLHA